MKYTNGLITLGILSVAAASTAQAGMQGFYVKGSLGGTDAKDVELRQYFGQALLPNSEISLDPGIRFGAHIGYNVTDWFAAEVETGVAANDIESITGASESDGTLTQVPLLLNAKFELPNSKVTPYLGAGFGLASTILTGDDLNIGNTVFSGSAADVVFAYQIFAGVDFAINDSMSVGAEYRFFHAEPATLTADYYVGTPPPSDQIKLGEAEIHAVSVTFTYRF